MRKIISFLLIMILGVSITYSPVTAANNKIDEELMRIKSYKLFNDSVFNKMDEAMTDKVYYAAIKKFIEPYGSSAQNRFDNEVKSSLNDGNLLTYQDVISLTYLAAFATDTNHLTQSNCSPFYYSVVGDEEYWYQENKCNEAYEEREKGYYTFYEPWGEKTKSGDEFVPMCIFFSLIQTSQVSGAALYDIKSDRNLKIFSSNCPNDVAVRMLGRLYETTKPVDWKSDDALYQEMHKNASERKDAILNSKSEYTTGTKTYYVSTEGNDANDGLSDNTPWKSLGKASEVDEPGSVVLLKRGDIWKGESLYCHSYVTYSAYGNGPKPTIYGCADEADKVEDWILCSDLSDSEKKIWKYKTDLFDVGGIIFNDGDSYAIRKYGWWVDSKWVDIDNVKEELTPSYALKEDLEFISLPNLEGLSYPIHFGATPRKGPVYLRCDKGNPAEIFKSINFEQSTGPKGGPITCLDYATIDNLAVKYFGETGITSDFADTKTQGMSMPGVTVSNCEVAYGGNIYLSIMSAEPIKFAYLTGDGIYGICNGATIKNNYVHDVDCVGVRVENSGDMPDRNIDQPMLVSNNLCERNGEGIWISTVAGNITYKKITIDNNIIMDNGTGWVHGGGCELCGLSVDWLGEGECKDLTVSNNVVFNTPYAVYDSVGKYLKEENNHFYMGSYANNVIIKDGLIFTLNREDKTASVIGTSIVNAKKVVIPANVKDGDLSYKVTGIAPKAFYGNKNITNITIKSKGIKKIGSKAFSKMSSKMLMKPIKAKKKAYSKLLKKSGYSGKIK